MPATFQWLAFFIELTPHPNPYVLIFSALAEKIPD